MRYVILFSLFFLCTQLSKGQDSTFVQNNGFGPEIQAYPTGIIPGVVWYKKISPKSFIHVRLGYNYIRHGDAGLHQDERGDGWGGSLGYDRRIKIRGLNWMVGARCDLWRNNLEWQNNIGGPNHVSGISDVTVLQPTVRISYPIKSGNNFLQPTLSFGSEINIKTQGEDVGEGLILLIGLSYVFQ